MVKTKDRPLTTKTQPVPTADIRVPATAGPMSRARLKPVEFSPTALGRSSEGTSSETKTMRGGPSKAATVPVPTAKRQTCHTCAPPDRTSTPRPNARRARHD